MFICLRPPPLLGFSLRRSSIFVGSESGQSAKLMQNMVSNRTQHPSTPSQPNTVFMYCIIHNTKKISCWKPTFLYHCWFSKSLLFNFLFLENCSLPWMISSTGTQTSQNWTNPRAKVSGELRKVAAIGSATIGKKFCRNLSFCRIRERI